jgi:purine-cytosine permease-like protein
MADIEQPAVACAESETTNEFERERVPSSRLLGFKSFIGMYAGEHCAGTELMIGPLFVACGVSAYDLIVGLLVGNLMAVLSWMTLTAPIATRARLTLYYQLEKICGRKLVTIYNLANGIMFCFLAGAMITVSATAVGAWAEAIDPSWSFNLPQNVGDFKELIYPNSVGWVVSAAVVGLVIAVVASLGYNSVAKFANIAAPWMVLVFVTFGLVALKQFLDATGAEINSAGDLWNFAKTKLWPGGDPLPGQVKFTIWHVIFFSWFCNAAMHVGMADLSVFRFAKKSWYSVATSAGMYVGHFMAWIAASLLFSFRLTQDPTSNILPGPLTFDAVGYTGLVCVIIAGWTTANPTIYRAGLAFQAIVPRLPRFWVTMAAGLIATIAGVFPAIAMRLLDFVALYGLLLAPMGAIVFVDFWLVKKMGMQNYYAEKAKISIHWAAGIAWVLTLAICLILVQKAGLQIFFATLPGWFIAAVLYLILSKMLQKKIDVESVE